MGEFEVAPYEGKLNGTTKASCCCSVVFVPAIFSYACEGDVDFFF